MNSQEMIWKYVFMPSSFNNFCFHLINCHLRAPSQSFTWSDRKRRTRHVHITKFLFLWLLIMKNNSSFDYEPKDENFFSWIWINHHCRWEVHESKKKTFNDFSSLFVCFSGDVTSAYNLIALLSLTLIAGKQAPLSLGVCFLFYLYCVTGFR